MKAFVKMGFLAMVVSFVTSCTPDQPVVDDKTGGLDSLNKSKVDAPADTSHAFIEEVDTNATKKGSMKGN